ncbi:ATP-binding protein [Mucilaginibacter sp. UR6-1]|uniref:strictosidine synthase family protein n=1 Tax=Mucilaginibacter sp. UR6-1 TaxID=1435643 RepID=UPI001E493A43|nr:ATP-binding protein [Mucilaginibacter sp. UR6-1]MCC8409987.1 ATP-binding protein [Mucilaginibacter sp. UR6-1]
MIKITASLFLLAMPLGLFAQHSVQKLWQTDSVLATPESVLPAGKVLYVSLISGNSGAKDGIGGVAKVSPDGKIIDTAFVTGLNAPKGMGIYNNTLYVADLSELVSVDLKTGKVNKKLIDENAGLNDVSIDAKGVIYVSDPKNARVFRFEGDKQEVYLEGLKGVNGVKSIGNNLYVLTADAAYKAGADKKLTKICDLEHGGDGIEPVGYGDLLITAWVGYLYYVTPDGKKQVLLDTHEGKSKTADIGYDPKKQIIYVPTFFGNSVTAYKLN